MEIYRNYGGDSGVKSYLIGTSSITVKFSNGTYEYTYTSAGAERVEEMKKLARAGKGLNSFINTYVKTLYARKVQR